MAVFSMSVVCKLTELTARQIRYYETHELIKPANVPKEIKVILDE